MPTQNGGFWRRREDGIEGVGLAEKREAAQDRRRTQEKAGAFVVLKRQPKGRRGGKQRGTSQLTTGDPITGLADSLAWLAAATSS